MNRPPESTDKGWTPKKKRDSSAVKDYVRGYQEVPESAEEVEAVHRRGIAVLAGEPWA